MVEKELLIDPITRIEGHLALRVIVDTKTKKPKPESVRSFVTMFRGFEVFDLEDLQRTCHTLTAVSVASAGQAMPMLR